MTFSQDEAPNAGAGSGVTDMTVRMPMLHEVVEHDGDRNGDGAFVGIVVRRPRRNGRMIHVLVGYFESHRGRYGSQWEGVEYGVTVDDPRLRLTGRVVKP